MCSIIGCIHKDVHLDVADVLVESMGKMEYRGYDSVGLATLSDHEILIKQGIGGFLM